MIEIFSFLLDNSYELVTDDGLLLDGRSQIFRIDDSTTKDIIRFIAYQMIPIAPIFGDDEKMR